LSIEQLRIDWLAGCDLVDRTIDQAHDPSESIHD
jgi:hypothetical protein